MVCVCVCGVVCELCGACWACGLCVMCVGDVWCVVCVGCVCVCGVCWVRVDCVGCVWCVLCKTGRSCLSSVDFKFMSTGPVLFFCVRAIIKHTQFHVVASLVQMADLKLEHHRADISVNLIRFQVDRQLFNIFDCSPRNA